MRVIVSNVLEDIFRNYKVVSRVRDVQALVEEGNDISYIIIHKTDEEDLQIGVGISSLVNKVPNCKFAYISEDMAATIVMAIKGAGGLVVEDEFYFEDEDELDALLGDEENEDDAAALCESSIVVVKDFVTAFVRGEGRINTPAYLDQVTAAVTDLALRTQEQTLQLQQMGNSAMTIFAQVMQLIRKMDDARLELQNRIDGLTELSEKASHSPREKFGGVSFFPPVDYVGTAKVLVIRELSPCRYLTWFLLSYYKHVMYVKNKRAKLVIVHAKGKGAAKKYSDFTSITQESINDENLYNADLIATNNPKKEVMTKILRNGANVVIVVDRLYGGDNPPIVKGKVHMLNAVSGMSDLTRYKVAAKDCIFSTTSVPNAFITISTIKNFARDMDNRVALYNSACEEDFNKLDTLLGL